MSRFDRKAQLSAAGFQHTITVAVAVPYQLWHVSLLIEYDRKFRLAEEVTLRLIREGLDEPGKLAYLLGLEEDEAFRQVLVDLLRGTYIRYRDERLELTPLGQKATLDLRRREQRRFNDVHLLYDAYRDTFSWYGEAKLLSAAMISAGDLKILPDVVQISHEELAGRFQNIQKLVEREGVVGDPKPQDRKDLLLVEPIWWEPLYVRADMEVWLDHQERRTDWRLLQTDLELFEETEAFKRIEAEGVRIIPKIEAGQQGG